MAFCSKCGSQLPDGAKFCENCGNAVFQPANNYSQQNYNQQYYTAPDNGSAPIPEDNSVPDPNDVANNKLYAVLSYLGILVLIPYFSEKGKASPFVRYHSNQGIYLFIIGFVISVIMNIFARISDSFILSSLSSIFGTLMLVLDIIGILNACQGKMKPLPIINDIAKKFKK